MISGNIKSLIRRVTNYTRVEEREKVNQPTTTTNTTIHSTPAGCYPENGPKPSKLGVLCYIMSILFSLIGIISLTNYPFVTKVSSANNLHLFTQNLLYFITGSRYVIQLFSLRNIFSILTF